MNVLHRFSIRRPVLVLSLAILATGAMAPGLARLRLRTDGHALIPERAEAVVTDREVRRAFDLRDPLVVLIRPRHPDGVFNARTLRLVSDLSAAIPGVPGLDTLAIRSLATERSDRFVPGTLARKRLLEPVPETPEAIAALRSDLDAIGLLTGRLVSFDGRATAIVVRTPPESDRAALIGDLQATLARADTAGHQVDLIGPPVAEHLLGLHILEDLGLSRLGLGGATSVLARRSPEGLGPVSRLRVAVAREIGLLPLAVVAMALVFLIAFRSVTATLLPLGEALACLLFVFGLMGWVGVPVYLTMAVLPVILVSMGLADEIHVFTAYTRRRAAHPGETVADSVRAALDETALPVVATALTTAIGFLSFAFSPLAPVRAFGVFTAAGIVFCMLWTLTAIPALLVLLAPRVRRAPGAPTVTTPRHGWAGFAALAGRRPWVTLAATALVLGVSALGIRRLAIQDSWIDGFAKDSAFHRATSYFNRQFFGTHMLYLAIDTGRLELRGAIPAEDLGLRELLLPGTLVPDPAVLVGCSLSVARRTAPRPIRSPYGEWTPPAHWSSRVERAFRRDGRIVVVAPAHHGSARFLLSPTPQETLVFSLHARRLADPRVLRRIEDLEQFIRAQARWTVGGVIGPPDQIATAEFLASDRVQGFRSIPGDPDRARWLWSAMGLVQGPERVRETVDTVLTRGLISVYLREANFRDTARLLEAVAAYARERLAPDRIRYDLAGDVAVSQTLIDAIVTSQTRSLAGSLLGILLVTALMFRSLGWGLVCVTPAAAAVAVTFAFMGGSGMPLGVATSMFAAMVLGIGVDFTIHLVHRYRHDRRRGAQLETAVTESLAATGPAIVVNGLAVATGFGLLVLSRVPANSRLGAITVVSLLACLAATLIVVPALIRATARREAAKG